MTQPIVSHDPKAKAEEDTHGVIDRIVSVVKHVHEEHVRHEHLRHQHELEEAQHLAEHAPEAKREDLPF
jgi:hypothetical protein